MNYEEFWELLTEELQEHFGEEFQFYHTTIKKANDVNLHALVIKNGKVNVSPAIYLDHFFQSYQNGELALFQIVDKIANIYEKAELTENFDATFLSDYSMVKSILGASLVNTEKSKNLLMDIPHRKILDLSVTYCIYPKHGETNETWSIPIKNQYLEAWGVTEEDLYQQVMKNIHNEFELVNLTEYLETVLGSIPEERSVVSNNLYLLTNERKVYGAVQMLNVPLLKIVAEIFQDDFYILPASVHEVLLLPASVKFVTLEEMEYTVKEVNRTQLAPTEILSENIYRYERITGTITIVT